MRVVALVGIACAMACAAEGPYIQPPPPADAVASCAYQLGSGAITVWLDANGRSTRIDEALLPQLDEAGETYELSRDDVGRLVEVRSLRLAITRIDITYEPDRITQVAGDGTTTYDLVDGNVVHVEGPYQVDDYTYDSAGRVIAKLLNRRDRVFSTTVTYDALGRVSREDVAVNGGGAVTKQFTYVADDPTELTITRSVAGAELGQFEYRWTYNFDARQRVIGEQILEGNGLVDEIATYTYTDGEIDVAGARSGPMSAIGQCEPVEVVRAPYQPPTSLDFVVQFGRLTDPIGDFGVF